MHFSFSNHELTYQRCASTRALQFWFLSLYECRQVCWFWMADMHSWTDNNIPTSMFSFMWEQNYNIKASANLKTSSDPDSYSQKNKPVSFRQLFTPNHDQSLTRGHCRSSLRCSSSRLELPLVSSNGIRPVTSMNKITPIAHTSAFLGGYGSP